jgi:hypothetical protein
MPVATPFASVDASGDIERNLIIARCVWLSTESMVRTTTTTGKRAAISEIRE